MPAPKELNVAFYFMVSAFVLSGEWARGHEAKDLDDSILYKIDFEVPNFMDHPELKNHLQTVFTHEKEKYECVIPVVEDTKPEKELNDPELSPYSLLHPIFTSPSCSYRIEAYWSYEICHGRHVRQYHEEREGKSVKFQEYYLGTWNEDKTVKLLQVWKENLKAGIKSKTTKIDNTNYPYFEVEMTDGTMCDIINAPRTTAVRYVCYLHGKNEIYSFKETSSCNYEAIILTSALCLMPAFHPEETKEVSIKCFNSLTDTHKPLSLLIQELNDLQMVEEYLPVSKETAAAALAHITATGDRFVLNKIVGDVDKLVFELTAGSDGIEVDTSSAVETSAEVSPTPSAPAMQILSIRDFLLGDECLIGGTGWWKYEFCFYKHVRQFHRDKKSETEVYLGFFSAQGHRKWAEANPEKGTKRKGHPIWQHYEKGSHCDRTGLPREVDIKLTCTQTSNILTSVSMYLLEPKTCQYILVLESPIVCELYDVTDEQGLLAMGDLMRVRQKFETLFANNQAVLNAENQRKAQSQAQSQSQPQSQSQSQSQTQNKKPESTDPKKNDGNI